MPEFSPANQFAEVSGQEATGEVAEVFAEIRTCLNAQTVNLIWRRIAAINGALPAAWFAVKPLYLGGSMEAGAERLLAGLSFDKIPCTDVCALAASFENAKERAKMQAVLNAFDMINPHNLIALSTLFAMLKVPGEFSQVSGVGHRPIVRANKRGPKLPAAIAFDLATIEQQALVRRFNAIAADTETEAEQATLPRILLH